MSTKKIRYLIAATFFVFAFLLFLDFKICLKGSNCTFHGLEVAGFILYPIAILFLGFVGLIFIALALVHKKRLENNNVASQNIMYKPINPIVILGIGTVMFLVTFFDSSIGLDLFGAKMMLFFGAILFLCVGFIKFFKGLRGLIIFVVVFVFFVAGFSYIKYPELYKRESNEADLVEDIDNTNVSFKINPKDYSLVNYPLKESPIYDQRADYCYKPESQEEIIQKDTRLVKNSGEIVIPSMRQLIFASENKKQSCRAWINFFSIPQNGNYLYLEVQESNKGGAEFFLYKLDLFNFSIKKMSFPVEIGIFDMNYDYYKILSDGKRLVKWSIDKVYLINLETNSHSILYTAPRNQWFVASMADDEVLSELKYDIKVDGEQIVIGIHSRDKTKNNALLELHNSGEDIELMFIKKVTISIPDN